MSKHWKKEIGNIIHNISNAKFRTGKQEDVAVLVPNVKRSQYVNFEIYTELHRSK